MVIIYFLDKETFVFLLQSTRKYFAPYNCIRWFSQVKFELKILTHLYAVRSKIVTCSFMVIKCKILHYTKILFQSFFIYDMNIIYLRPLEFCPNYYFLKILKLTGKKYFPILKFLRQFSLKPL